MGANRHSKMEKKKKQKTSPPLSISLEETKELLKKIEEKKLEDKDFERIKAFIKSFIFIRNLLERKKVSIKRLKNLIFGKTEKSKNVLGKTGSKEGGESNEEMDASTGEEGVSKGEESNNAVGEKKKIKKKGHGRNGASAYVGAEKVYVPHEKLKAGQLCPNCEKGKLYKFDREGVEIRIKGSSPINATVYKLEKLRCALCQELYTAQLPREAGDDKYDAKAGAMIAMLKYGSGFPFYRLDNFQKALGVPVAASTQWEIVVSVFRVAVHLYEELVRQAAQGELMHTDDTGVKILSVIKENKLMDRQKPQADEDDAVWEKRKATYTSGIMSKIGDRVIVLYFSGKKYAGENLDDVLRKRAAHLGPPLQMSDALAQNYPKELATIIINCLSHGRRKFVELIENYPVQCRFVIETLAEVYKYDEIARQERMTPHQRLCFHQQHSKPEMDKLEKWFEEQFAQKKIEPNSNLGSAIKYMQNHWERLTGFLRLEGAPLDNNCLERALKVAILNRKNAYFYRTKNGANVGDVFMSIIETCRQAKVNPIEFLTMIQENSIDVLKNPAKWIPWVYKKQYPNETRKK